MHLPEPARARRRRLTLKVALRRRRRHLAIIHPGYLTNPGPDCICGTSAFYFSKKCWPRHCSKRNGSPKAGHGLCGSGRRWAVEVRMRSRRLARDLTAGRIGWDWVEPGATFYGEVEPRRLREASRRPRRARLGDAGHLR